MASGKESGFGLDNLAFDVSMMTYSRRKKPLVVLSASPVNAQRENAFGF